MTPLKWIVNEAKKLKKQYPHRFKKWTDYVAQASAIYASKHKGKSPVGKKHKAIPVKKKAVKKKTSKVGYSKLRLKNDKELTKAIKNEPDTLFPYTHKQRLVLAAKKHYDKLNRDIHKVSGAKKKAAKKSPARMLHKDTKSHNVNIRVMSGLQDLHKLHYNIYDLIKSNEIDQRKLKQNIIFNGKLGEHFYTKSEINIFKKELIKLKKIHTQLKKIAKEQEKAVKITK